MLVFLFTLSICAVFARSVLAVLTRDVGGTGAAPASQLVAPFEGHILRIAGFARRDSGWASNWEDAGATAGESSQAGRCDT